MVRLAGQPREKIKSRADKRPKLGFEKQEYPLVRFERDGFHGVLAEPIVVFLNGLRVEVPVGFATDWATVPRIFWRVIPPWGKYLRASVVHDFLYRSGLLPKAEADMFFYLLMLSDGARPWRALLLYRGVKWFGGGVWKRYRKLEEEANSS